MNQNPIISSEVPAISMQENVFYTIKKSYLTFIYQGGKSNRSIKKDSLGKSNGITLVSKLAILDQKL